MLLSWLLQPTVAPAVTLGQIDDFQDGTTQNWLVGFPGVQPANIADGGPAGAGDAFLQLTADGGTGQDPNNKLVVINQTQWTGDYLAAGVNAITMSVKNLSAMDLYLRLRVSDDAIRTPANAAISTKPVLLPAGGGWTFVVFPIAPANLTALAGSATTALTKAKELRLFHNPNPTFPPPVVVAQLGVDNIHAVRGIPLPSLPLLLLFDD